MPVPPYEPAIIPAFHVPPDTVPTLVRLDVKIVPGNAVPVSVPAGATTATDVSTITRPYASVVTTGIAVEVPTVVGPGPVGIKLIALPTMFTLPAPVLV